jgi:hypothetical protein
MLETVVILVVFGILALLLGLSRWLAHRPWAAAGNVAIGLVLFYIAHRTYPAALDLRTYEPLPPKAMVAQVYCERTGPHAYRITLTRLPGGRMQVYEVAGDEWRLDARTLVWKGRAAEIGMRPAYRLDRLTTRTVRADESITGGPDKPLRSRDALATPTSAVTSGEADPATTAGPSSYVLDDRGEPGEDIWAQARTATHWEREVDASHAQGPWRRMVDGARYDVWITRGARGAQASIDAQPGNEAAAKAMLYTAPNDKARAKG